MFRSPPTCNYEVWALLKLAAKNLENRNRHFRDITNTHILQELRFCEYMVWRPTFSSGRRTVSFDRRQLFPHPPRVTFSDIFNVPMRKEISRFPHLGKIYGYFNQVTIMTMQLYIFIHHWIYVFYLFRPWNSSCLWSPSYFLINISKMTVAILV